MIFSNAVGRPVNPPNDTGVKTPRHGLVYPKESSLAEKTRLAVVW